MRSNVLETLDQSSIKEFVLARIVVEGSTLKFSLTRLEVIGAFHKSPQAKISNLVKVTKVENPWTTSVLSGVRAPGTGIPLVIMLGTLRYRKGRDFCAIYKRRPVFILEFMNEEFKRWIITADSQLPESVGTKVSSI